MIVGIVGGGQLGRMMVLAGLPLGLRFLVLDPAPDACAGQVAELLQGDYLDRYRLARLAERANVVTFDFENVPVEATHYLEQRVAVYPPPAALAASQDRLTEKTLFRELGIPTPDHAAVDSPAGLEAAVGRIGLPAVLKTRRLGYDGKGQRLLKDPADLEPAWAAIGGAPLILEAFVPFQREVSLLAVRGRGGETAFYPLVENEHGGGILRRSTAPVAAPDLERAARDHAGRLLERLDYVGLLTLEFFVADGELIINEIAPRVHNSGHWTLEGAQTSQFENHLRAILGLPLGSTAAVGHSAMVNFIGRMPDRAAVLAIPGAHFHDYGKVPKPGRKLGHGTVWADDPQRLQVGLKRLLALAAS
ncbi:MAG: 5-(carboxyamino)imidazole ribonucleotide synthase [Pseudomonadota bacterium]|nr:5-(carboxyamino)imidazole ribonucleotide synthase [Pseudomonadota bacterium]